MRGLKAPPPPARSHLPSEMCGRSTQTETQTGQKEPRQPCDLDEHGDPVCTPLSVLVSPSSDPAASVGRFEPDHLR